MVIDWAHDIDSSGRRRSWSANIWPFWAIVWEHEPGRWRWQHLPHPGRSMIEGGHDCADAESGREAAQRWFDAEIVRLTSGDMLASPADQADSWSILKGLSEPRVPKPAAESPAMAEL